MKTEDFIRALSEDRTPRPSLSACLWRALPLALLASVVLFFAIMGLRANMGQAEVVRAIAMKLSVTLPLALAGMLLARRMSEPGRAPGMLNLLLALPLVILTTILVWDIALHGFDHFATRLFGHNYIACLLSIPLFSVPPLAGLLYAFRLGAPTEPGRAGGMAGLGAAGLGASLYALHCPDDSPLFIMAWYSLATFVTASCGWLAGRRALRW